MIMQNLANQPPSLEESWALGWAAFLEALAILAMEAPEQCRAMGNYNVPWELQHDVLAGEYLLSSPVSRVTELQRNLLVDLLRELRALPSEAIGQPNTIEGNLRGMSHVAWSGLRDRAAQALVAVKGRA